MSEGTMTPLTPLISASDDPPKFRLWGQLPVRWNRMVMLLAVMSCLGVFGQQVSLPLYLHTLGDNGGPYFVLWFCSLFFTIFFSCGTFYLWCAGAISREMLYWKWHFWFCIIGFCDALNGILMVYSAPLTRVPGPLQSILLQAMAPLTLFMSKLTLRGRQYNASQLFGVCLVLLGVFYSLIPMFVHAARGDTGASMHVGAWWWPFVTFAGILPGAAMNVVQEHLQERFRETATSTPRMSVFLLQAVESFYQLCWMSVFFFFDLLPNFGTNPGDPQGFLTSFKSGFQCFFRDSAVVADNPLCDYSSALGLTFIVSYICTYIFGTFMTLFATANYNSVVVALPPVCAMVFWFAFPSVNSWAGGTPYSLTGMDGAMNITALVIILPGIILYRRNEEDQKASRSEELSIDGYEELRHFPLH